MGVIKGDTRSLDNGSFELWNKVRLGGTYRGLFRFFGGDMLQI